MEQLKFLKEARKCFETAFVCTHSPTNSVFLVHKRMEEISWPYLNVRYFFFLCFMTPMVVNFFFNQHTLCQKDDLPRSLKYCWSPKDHLFVACAQNNLDVVKNILRGDPKLINQTDVHGYTSLFIATHFGYENIFHHLVQQGAEGGRFDGEGHSLIYWSIINQREFAFAWYLKRHFRQLGQDQSVLQDALRAAAEINQPRYAQKILKVVGKQINKDILKASLRWAIKCDSLDFFRWVMTEYQHEDDHVSSDEDSSDSFFEGNKTSNDAFHPLITRMALLYCIAQEDAIDIFKFVNEVYFDGKAHYEWCYQANFSSLLWIYASVQILQHLTETTKDFYLNAIDERDFRVMISITTSITMANVERVRDFFLFLEQYYHNEVGEFLYDEMRKYTCIPQFMYTIVDFDHVIALNWIIENYSHLLSLNLRQELLYYLLTIKKSSSRCTHCLITDVGHTIDLDRVLPYCLSVILDHLASLKLIYPMACFDRGIVHRMLIENNTSGFFWMMARSPQDAWKTEWSDPDERPSYQKINLLTLSLMLNLSQCYRYILLFNNVRIGDYASVIDGAIKNYILADDLTNFQFLFDRLYASMGEVSLKKSSSLLKLNFTIYLDLALSNQCLPIINRLIRANSIYEGQTLTLNESELSPSSYVHLGRILNVEASPLKLNSCFSQSLDALVYGIIKRSDQLEKMLEMLVSSDMSNALNHLCDFSYWVKVAVRIKGSELVNIAARHNALSVLKYLHDRNICINEFDQDGYNIAYYAITQESVDMLEYAYSNGVNCFDVSAYHYDKTFNEEIDSELYLNGPELAVLFESEIILKLLIKLYSSSQPKEKPEYKFKSTLIVSIRSAQFDMFKFLLDEIDFSCNLGSDEKHSSIAYFCTLLPNDEGILYLTHLLDHPKYADKTSAIFSEDFYVALCCTSPIWLKWAHCRGIKLIDKQYWDSGESCHKTELMVACQHDNMECAKWLIKHGSNPYKVDAHGRGLLDYYCNPLSELYLFLKMSFFKS